METFLDSSFFREKRAALLPTPAQIRALNLKNGKKGGRVSSRSFVKYGSRVTVTEGQGQVWIREKPEGRVDVPKMFGWARDQGQAFLWSVHKQPLADNFFTMKDQVLSPFQGVNAVEQFQGTLGIDVANPGPAVFTYNDLVALGWYPAYWGYCKAPRINVPDDRFYLDYEPEWKRECLPKIMSPGHEVKV
ncbi:hypothetical protein F5B17DRAFT_442659 [Nemania serpens]|nr:hypothetical protein F5B17DRAFT_442659 [Nemania serpens]